MSKSQKFKIQYISTGGATRNPVSAIGLYSSAIVPVDLNICFIPGINAQKRTIVNCDRVSTDERTKMYIASVTAKGNTKQPSDRL